MTQHFFLGLVVILIVYGVSGTGLSTLLRLTSEQNLGIVLSGILATANVVAAFAIIALTRNKAFHHFVRVFTAGIAIRLAVLLAIIFIIFKFMNVDDFVFIVSLFILYFIFQIWELLIINKHLKQE